MAILFYTDNPQALLEKFEEKSRKSGTDSITTWELKDGKYLHTAAQLVGKGRLSPSIQAQTKPFYLEFMVVGAKKDDSVTTYAFGELQGNILSTFIQHFSGQFTSAAFVDKRKQ